MHTAPVRILDQVAQRLDELKAIIDASRRNPASVGAAQPPAGVDHVGDWHDDDFGGSERHISWPKTTTTAGVDVHLYGVQHASGSILDLAVGVGDTEISVADARAVAAALLDAADQAAAIQR